MKILEDAKAVWEKKGCKQKTLFCLTQKQNHLNKFALSSFEAIHYK